MRKYAKFFVGNSTPSNLTSYGGELCYYLRPVTKYVIP